MDVSDIASLLASLSSSDDALRKMAVFKLQSSISDPSLADAFISSGGLSILRGLIMTSSGNTLAYSLQSLTKVLEVDMGWETFEASGAAELVERVIELIVTHPLVNILRGAMSICAAVVGHSYSSRSGRLAPGAFGFQAIKPAIAIYPQFYDMVVQQLDSADHALCGNAMYLLNALMRDVLTNDDAGEEWLKFIARLESLGVMRKACELMKSSALQDLAHPLLETQIIAKIIIRKRRELPFDQENPQHRRMLKVVYASSKPIGIDDQRNLTPKLAADDTLSKGSSRRHNPQKWRRLGFSTESPAREFESSGYLSVRDLEHYAVKNESTFQKILQEQATKQPEERCPIARCSQYVTWLLYTHFECDNAEDPSLFRVLDSDKAERFDEIFKPLILEWSRLHVACLSAFIRLWAATGATHRDFEKVVDLMQILIRIVIGGAQRTDPMSGVEEKLSETSLAALRDQQMKDFEDSFEDKWSDHLSTIREKLRAEATEFVREQRIRCLTAGAWFPFQKPVDDAGQSTVWRYARLSTNKRYLHYRDFEQRRDIALKVAELPEKVRVTEISSVAGVGLIHPQPKTGPAVANGVGGEDATDQDMEESDANSTSTIQATRTRGSTMTRASAQDLRVAKPAKPVKSAKLPKTAQKENVEDKRITIRTLVNASSLEGDDSLGSQTERVLLTLTCPTQELACEWLDGLLMLLGMDPKTEETKRLIEGIVDYGLRIRLLNVRLEDTGLEEEDMDGRGVNGDRGGSKRGIRRGEVPSREGVDGDYYYA